MINDDHLIHSFAEAKIIIQEKNGRKTPPARNSGNLNRFKDFDHAAGEYEPLPSKDPSRNQKYGHLTSLKSNSELPQFAKMLELTLVKKVDEVLAKQN